MVELIEVLALLEAVPFRTDPATLDTVLEGARTRELVGRSAGVSLPRSAFWDAVLSPEERARVIEMLRATAADGVPRVTEHRALVPGRPLATFRTAVQLAPGPPRQLVGVMLDVTAARASERQSQEVEAWLATLGESLPFDFWICDGLGRFVLQNPVSRRRLGNVLGRTVADLALSSRDAERWRQTLARALRGERVREELTVSVEGEDRVYSRLLSPIRAGEASEVSGAVGVDIDVTELKRTEQRLRSSLEELRQAQDELVRRERLAVLGEMAAAVAHEVRNPLGAMCNVVELLRRRAPRNQEEADLLGILSEELNRLDLLVVNLFDLVRPLKAVLRPHPLTTVLEDAIADALRSTVQPERVRVVRRIDVAPLEVSIDRQLLGVALINVMRNALQAMPDGGELGIDLGREQRGEQTWARIAIRDTGEGMAPEVRGRIFEPFFTTRPTGSGLGLAIVKRVIAEHQGELEVQSERGQGTAFVMRLPCGPRPPVTEMSD